MTLEWNIHYKLLIVYMKVKFNWVSYMYLVTLPQEKFRPYPCRGGAGFKKSTYAAGQLVLFLQLQMIPRKASLMPAVQ